MKKHLLIGLFCLIPLAGISQTTLYGIIQPSDLGLGVRVDQQIKSGGMYASVSRGDYKFNGGYVNNHWKVSLGGVVHTPHESFLTLGLNYHNYGQYLFPDNLIPDNALTPFSFDMGVGVKLGRFVSEFTLDILKWDVGVGLGYTIFK